MLRLAGGTECPASGPATSPMPSSEDHRLGRFYTPPDLADLLARLALGDREQARVWDPTCGGGALLQAVARRAPHALVGTDVDAAALTRLGAALPTAELRCADLFDLDPDALGRFDAIVGNPPFLRTERIPAARRAVLRRRVSDALGCPVDGSADVSLLALVWCCRFLAPGGRLAFVMPSTSLDVRGGATLRATLADRLRLVLDSAVEAWFSEVAVNTVVVVVEQGAASAPRFARLRRPVRDVSADALLTGPAGRSVPPGALAAPRWSPLLKAPAVWWDLRARAGARLVPLGERLHLAYGTKPGISSFFAPREDVGIEPHLLVPFLRTLRGHHRYEVLPHDVRDRLFVVPPDVADEEVPPGARAWIDAGASRVTRSGVPWPEAPSVQANQPWWRLPPPRSGPVLVPQFRGDRHHVIANPALLPVNNSAWHGTWRDPDHADLGVALLNSTIAALSAEVEGRTNLGEGLLTLYGPELRSMVVPDPGVFSPRQRSEVLAAWEVLRGRPVLPFPEECARADRQALDTAILRGLGLDPGLAPSIAEGAIDLLSVRLRLADARRRERSGVGSSG